MKKYLLLTFMLGISGHLMAAGNANISNQTSVKISDNNPPTSAPVDNEEILKVKAEKGDVVAQRELGKKLLLDADAANGDYGRYYCLDSATGCQDLLEDSQEWLTKAAKLGDAEAQYLLSNILLFKANDLEQDRADELQAEANTWLHKAAQQNYAPACTALGDLSGDNTQEAIPLLGKGVALGDISAAYQLGYIYQTKLHNIKLAVYWYRIAAQSGNINAQMELAEMYQNGDGVAQDNAKALYWYKKAADPNNKKVYLGPGRFFDPVRISAVYHNSANIHIGEIYNRQAIIWYQKAAEKGNIDSMIYLGLMYENGYGVAANDITAMGWYTKATQFRRSQTPAAKIIGLKYFSGRGVPQNDKLAYMWLYLDKTYYSQDETTSVQLKQLESRMSKDEIAVVKQQAEDYFMNMDAED